MGENLGIGNAFDGEMQVHAVTVSEFEIDATSVTNADFEKFITATGYKTEAEVFGSSAVFHLLVDAPDEDVDPPLRNLPWWQNVRNADWRHPGGANSNIDALMDHPVVHVSWNDAVAYCEWADRRLPTEAEWECASRGGLVSETFPWGSELMTADGKWQANIFQGDFPNVNTTEDGFLSTAPVRTYAPNAYGLWQTVGNVWEWCSDFFDANYYRYGEPFNPQGPSEGQSRVMRGGSFLCHDSYCNRYRNAARTKNTPDSSMSNTGFRTVMKG